MTESPNEQPAVPEVGEVAPWDGPPLVYGLDNFDGSLMVVPREWAERGADEFTRWLTARTWREALAVADSMTVVKPPFDPSEQRKDLGEDGLDGPFDAREEIGYWYSDEDPFPTDPAVCAALTIPEAWAVGGIGGYGLDGLYIHPVEEPLLLAYARAAGAEITRDDDLINRLYWPGDVGREWPEPWAGNREVPRPET